MTFLTVSDLAERWKVSPKHIWNEQAKGALPIPTYRPLGKPLFKLEDIVTHEDQSKIMPE